jgi:GTP-binding protein YchF
MSLRVGIVGLPNVGKSTLFNALTKQQAEAQNFPFTTIEPNVGIVAVPDVRLQKLTGLSKSEKTVPTTIEFVDIAGLVKGAHEGEGLGNKFLSHIREVDAIAHVVRFFEDPNVTHVANRVDPIGDAETIETELALADLATIEKMLPRIKDEAKTAQMGQKGASKDAIPRLALFERLQKHLADGKAARTSDLTAEEWELLPDAHLLTAKPTLYVANVSEEQIRQADSITADFTKHFSPVLPLSVKIEQELVELSDEERRTFLAEYGLTETGLARLIQESYKLLNLITFFTTGPKETRAWTVTRGSKAPQAAGKIHSDFERGFIRAETVAYDDLAAAGSYAAVRSTGKLRDEGKEYIVQDGDVVIFKFSV